MLAKHEVETERILKRIKLEYWVGRMRGPGLDRTLEIALHFVIATRSWKFSASQGQRVIRNATNSIVHELEH